jgi:alpha-1,2-mannosyltransferase
VTRRSSSTPPYAWSLVFLAVARLTSAALNIVHDCDEVFNYWEPLHYLLYGSGMQTWEYSGAFALRPYLYLLIHGGVGAPAAALLGNSAGKFRCYSIRLCAAWH